MPSSIPTYAFHKPTGQWRAKGRSPVGIDQDPGSNPTGENDTPNFRPVSYATLSEARAALDAPTDANYVMWSHGNQHLEQVFASLGANDILVLPERPEPYLIDSSNGFMAAGVKEIDGTGANGMKDGSRVPIVSNNRLWFAMSRARRGILGMGPGVIIEPSASGWSAPRQPILQNEPDGTMLRYMLDGTSAPLVGAANKLIEVDHNYPFFANFTMRGRDFGGVGYSGISSASHTVTTIKRVHFDGCWRGFAGIPNGETGGLSILQGTYLVEHCDFTSNNGPSPIMWNRTTGGAVNHVRTSLPNYGMFTFWRSGGVNNFQNVWLNSRQTGMNLEENMAGFELNWHTGKLNLDYSGNKFHFSMNPASGSNKINLVDVIPSPNGYTPNRLCLNIYTTSGVQRRQDITCNTLTPEYLPGSYWIA